MSASAFRLSPRGVVRAAAWPLEALASFGAPDLHSLVNTNAHEPPGEFVRASEQVRERESAALWERTRGDPRFVTALLLASPSAYLRMEAGVAKREGPRNRALRLVEYMLYRYLARATSRVTPNGLWAGVTDVRLGKVSRLERCAARVRFTPELKLFQSFLRALGARENYRQHLYWRLNPTLSHTHGAGWRFLHRHEDGALEARSLGFDPALGDLLARLADCAPAALTTLAGRLAPRGAEHTWLQVLNQLVAGGVLVGGLDLPEKFATPWDALEAATEGLLPDDARAWRSSIVRLQQSCLSLEDAVWRAPPDQLLTLMSAPAGIVADLAAALALPAPVDGVILRSDLRLPWRLVIDSRQFTALRAALTDYDRHWQQGTSAATAERALRREAFCRGLGDGLGLGEAAAFASSLPRAGGDVWPRAATLAEASTAARLARWETLLRDTNASTTLVTDARSGHFDAAPYGCWLAGLDSQGVVYPHGVSDLPTIASARLGGVLELGRHDAWLAAAIAHASRGDVAPMEYLAPFETNPNSLASPALLGDAIGPWRAQRADRDLYGARLVRDTLRNRPLLEFRNGERCSVLTLATANLQAGDPLAEALLCTGYRDSTGRAGLAIDVPLQDELDMPRYSPRVSLPDGSVLNPRRTVLGADLDGLRRRRGVARFWFWQQLAKRYDWPAELEIGNQRGGMLRVARDSPLAVEALCKGLTVETPYLMVREAAPALSLPDGGSHVMELAMPFLRPRNDVR